MKLEVNGKQYTNFVSAACELRLDSLSSQFRFEAVAPKGQPLPFKGGESCRVYIDNEKILTGHIEVVNVNYSADNHVITVSGRDKTGDLLDSTIDAIPDLSGDGLTLKGIVEAIIKSVGLDIKVIDEVNPPAFTFTELVAAPEAGDPAFSFIEKYSKMRQVLLTSNADGDLVIASNSGITAKGAVQHIIGGVDNNVITSDFSYDTTGRYNFYKVASGMNPLALNQAGDTDLASVVNQSGGVFDNDIKRKRTLVLISETPYSTTPCIDRAKWEADIRRARGLIYSAVVPEFRVGGNSGELWQINRIYQIVDDYIGKTEQMLCNSVTFTFDIDSGSNTSLGFVGQEAYTLFLPPDPLAEIANNVQ